MCPTGPNTHVHLTLEGISIAILRPTQSARQLCAASFTRLVGSSGSSGKTLRPKTKQHRE